MGYNDWYLYYFTIYFHKPIIIIASYQVTIYADVLVRDPFDIIQNSSPDSKDHGGGPHVGPMNIAIMEHNGKVGLTWVS